MCRCHIACRVTALACHQHGAHANPLSSTENDGYVQEPEDLLPGLGARSQGTDGEG